MDELYAVLLSWAVTLSGHPMPDHKPTVKMVPHSYIQQVACNGRECKVMGWFPPGDTIYLDDRLDPAQSLLASSVVVHEMVHYLQHLSGANPAPYSCKASLAMEQEAYSVQRDYLLAYGVYQPVGVSMHEVGCELAAQ